MIRIVILLHAIALLVPQTAVSQTYEKGQKVVVISNAEIMTRENGVVDSVFPGLVLTVSDVSGNYVWVSNGFPGWLDKKHVMLLSDKAVEHLTKLLPDSSQKLKIFIGRSQTYLALKKLDEALADCSKALELATTDKEKAEVYAYRAYIWRWKYKTVIALEDADEAIRLDSKEDRHYVTRGNVLRDMKQYDKAISDYNDAISINPKNVWAFAYRGRAYLSKKEYQKAVKDYDKAIEMDQRLFFAIYDRAKAHFELRQYENALSDFKAYLTFRPKDRYCLYQCVRCLLGLKRPQEALAASNDFIRLFPSDYYGYELRSQSFSQLGQFVPARMDRAKSLEIRRKDKQKK